MKADVLRLIRSSKEYIGVETIAEASKMTVSAVKISINQLIAAGYDIEHDKEKGYRLISYPENVMPVELMSRTTTNWAGKQIYYRSEAESTNTEARFIAEDGRPHGTLLVADVQTKGRGRKGRSWIDDGTNSLAFSLLLRPEFGKEKASMVTMVMALSVAEVLQKLTELEIHIKWPNDVLVGNKKVAGILTEMATDSKGRIDHMIVGVGVNVNQKMFDEQIAYKATSLYMEKGERYSRADVILAILDFFEYYFDILNSTGDLSDVVSLYESFLININKEVHVHDPNGDFRGMATGINDFGELIVQKEDGTYKRVSQVDVSVRGVYGYV